MDKKKKKKSMAEADCARRRWQALRAALAVLNAASRPRPALGLALRDVPRAPRPRRALRRRGVRVRGRPRRGMAGEYVALGALDARSSSRTRSACRTTCSSGSRPKRSTPCRRRCCAASPTRTGGPSSPGTRAARRSFVRRRRSSRALAQIDGLLRRKDAPPPLSPVAAVDAELRAHLDKVAEALHGGPARRRQRRWRRSAPPGGLRRLAAEALADASTAAALRRLRAAATIVGDADARGGVRAGAPSA
ncbi:hypothetical protein SO694_00188012 [Aureococcus anophagefferens]|uniref:Uncharacterized protein n=1 Tax=Aureococcus anophagefferens TaxID=44056 RepID=A0ABR1FGL7_AURAN